ncbi:uncharacterized protein LOC135492889 [Lineus longissimus]|uniref:uncharacterized protein LOC135492889 n=1 Tax=Lineus longissimus TaxID=88925 RepID=UPI00315CA952
MHTDPDTSRAKLMHENTIEKGASFGELALLGDGTRTATIICCTQTELFQLDKATFMEICPGIFEDELDDKMEITRDQDMFTRFIPAKLAKTLCFKSQLVEYPIGRVIEKDWRDAANVYIVLKGRIVLYCKVDLRAAAKKRVGRKVSRISVTANMNKPLPWPSDMIGKENTRFAAIGMLQKGDHSDFRILKESLTKDMSSVIMISEGATALKIPVSTFQLTIPITMVDHYFRETTDRQPELPPAETICRRLLENLNWQGYRAKIVSTLRQEQHGAPMAQIPASKKGSSGWSKWPGFVRTTPKENRSNPVSPGEHTLEAPHDTPEVNEVEQRLKESGSETEVGESVVYDGTMPEDEGFGRRDSNMSLGNLESLDGEMASVEVGLVGEEVIESDRSDGDMTLASDVSDSITGSEGNIIEEVGKANLSQEAQETVYDGRYSRIAGNILKDLDTLTGYRAGTDSSRRSRTRNSNDWGFSGDSKWIGDRGLRGAEDGGDPNFHDLIEEEISDGELQDQATNILSPRSPSLYKRAKSVSWSDL